MAIPKNLIPSRRKDDLRSKFESNLEAWRRFASRIQKNPAIKNFILNRDKVCQVCGEAFWVFAGMGESDTVCVMRDLFRLLMHLVITFARMLDPGGVRVVAAESLVLKHQLIVINRSRHRAPNLTTLDRFVFGLTALFINPCRAD